MPIDPARASHLASIAREAGADVMEGDLRDPARIGRWQLGDVDVSQHLDRYRDQRLMLILAPLGEAHKKTTTCGVCGYVMDETEECPQCKFLAEYTTSIERRIQERHQLVDDLEAYLGGGETPEA